MCLQSLTLVQCSPGSTHLIITYMMFDSRYIPLVCVVSRAYVFATSPQLTCKGDQQYTSDGKEVEEEVQFVHHTSATSREKETFLVTELIPNTQYNCYIQTVAGEDQASTPHDDLTFKTEPGSE